MLSILEVLENAQYNLKAKTSFQNEMGLEQLANAIDLLQLGLDVGDEADLSLIE